MEPFKILVSFFLVNVATLVEVHSLEVSLNFIFRRIFACQFFQHAFQELLTLISVKQSIFIIIELIPYFVDPLPQFRFFLRS